MRFKNAVTPLRDNRFCGGKVEKRIFNKAVRAAMRGAAYREMREAAIEKNSEKIRRPSRRSGFSELAHSAIMKMAENFMHQPLPSHDIVIEVDAECLLPKKTRIVPVFYRIKGYLHPAHAVYC